MTRTFEPQADVDLRSSEGVSISVNGSIDNLTSEDCETLERILRKAGFTKVMVIGVGESISGESQVVLELDGPGVEAVTIGE